MKTVTKALLTVSALAALATPIFAQQREAARLPAECRAEIRQLCGGAQGQGGRGTMRTCLAEKIDQLSEACRTTIRERREARGGAERRMRGDGLPGEGLHGHADSNRKLGEPD
jgi:hypothetical protein